MNWFGIFVLGVVVGLFGCWLYLMWCMGWLVWWIVVFVGIVGVVVVCMVGNFLGLFYDGEMFEWLVCIGVVFFVVVVMVVLLVCC